MADRALIADQVQARRQARATPGMGKRRGLRYTSFMRRCLILLTALLIACGDSTDDTDAGTPDAQAGDAASTDGALDAGTPDAQAGDAGYQGCGNFVARCAPTEACATATCSFDPETVDCATACQKVADICVDSCALSSVCAGVLANVAQCTIICEMERTFSCGNATYGCYGANDSCDSVSACLACSN